MATKHMAKNLAQNLVYYAQLLKDHPQTPPTGERRPAARCTPVWRRRSATEVHSPMPPDLLDQAADDACMAVLAKLG